MKPYPDILPSASAAQLSGIWPKKQNFLRGPVTAPANNVILAGRL